MTKRLLNFITLLFVMLTTMSLNVAADSYNVAPTQLQPKVTVSPSDEYVNVPIRLMNWGTNPVSQITYTLYDYETQETSEPINMDFETPFADMQDVEIPIKPGKSIGESDVMLNITLVDGQYNSATIPYTIITRCTVLQAPKKRVVFEDFTGLWCQYCPRGIAIMEYMERIHPDDFIGISIHDDAMVTSAYDGVMNKWGSSRPTIMYNRYDKVNTYTGEGEYDMAMNQTACFDINVKANFDESGNNIIVSTDVLPCLTTDENDKYEVAYVLTADGLKNDSWVQAVAAGEWDGIEGLPEEYAPFLGGVSEARGLTFNQVAIASKGVEYGVEGSLTAPYTVGEMQHPTVTFENISQHNLIQDRSKLNVCAMVIRTTIDPDTKAVTKSVIDNAAKCRVGNDNPETGIKEITDSADSAITGYYSLDGRRLSAPAKGVTIVRYANGKTVKIQK